MSINIYSFYNNKGGVGKTTLCSNVATLYADQNKKTQVLVIDLCPQANVSQFLLGGGYKGYKANQKLQSSATRRNIVGFVDWLLRGNSNFTKPNTSYKEQVSRHNSNIPSNLYLIAGDSFLESLSLALSYAVLNPANLQAWKEFMMAIKKLCSYEHDEDEYEKLTVFIDCNPSFSIYTQMGLVSSDYIIVPMMADYSSIEGIKGIFMMLYGQYPTAALKKYADNIITFHKQVNNFNLPLPVIYEVVFNNFTQNMGVANAFNAIKKDLVDFCYDLYKKFPNLFVSSSTNITSVTDWESVFLSDVKDFHTSGKVSASLGIPLYQLPMNSNYTMPNGDQINMPPQNYAIALQNVRDLVARIK